MTWVPKYSAVFEEQIIDSVLALITRDMKPALDYFFPSSNYPDFRERSLGQILKNEFPLVAIGPNRNAISPSDDGSRVIQAARTDIYVGVSDDGPATVTEKIMRYVRCVDAVLRSGSKSDYFTSMNTFGFVLEAEHVYGPIGIRESIYFRSAIIELTIQINER